MIQSTDAIEAPQAFTSNAAPERMGQNLRQLGSDVITLAELQTELLKLDLKDWSRGAIRAVIFLAIAAVVLLASLPVLLISVGYFLEQATDLSLGMSMLIATGIGILIAAICGGLGIWSLKREHGILHRFSSELGKNVRWLKEVLTHPSSADTVYPR